MKSQVSEWFKEHRWYIILIALVVLVSVPILITILAPSVSSEISADGMLGYVIQAISAGGTIFLAYVAIRQNEKFKEENDRTQERLEKIAANANELSIIAKIIEYESANIARLTEKTGQYYNACAIDEMVEYLKCNNITQDENGLCLAKERKKSELKQLFSDVFDEVKLDFNSYDKIEETTDTICKLQEAAETLLEKMYEVSLPDSTASIEDEAKQLIKIRATFREKMNVLITRKRLNLDSIIYGQPSYDKIKDAHYERKKENRQNEPHEI